MGKREKRRLPQQMPQHNRSIYAAEIDQSEDRPAFPEIISCYSNSLPTRDRPGRAYLMLRLCCSKGRSMDSAATKRKGRPSREGAPFKISKIA